MTDPGLGTRIATKHQKEIIPMFIVQSLKFMLFCFCFSFPFSISISFFSEIVCILHFPLLSLLMAHGYGEVYKNT